MSVTRRPPSPAGLVPSAIGLIGNTPLVTLDYIHPGPGRILAKAEFMQPGGSVKDRAARAVLLAARADGRLAPGAPVVEMTSGNMGAGFVVLCMAVEPEGCQPLAGLPVTRPHHLMQGTSYGSMPPHWDASLMDVSIPITDGEVERWRRLLATREGLHVGYSAAANVGACAVLLASGRLAAEAVVTTVLCDTGLKY